MFSNVALDLMRLCLLSCQSKITRARVDPRSWLKVALYGCVPTYEGPAL